MADATRDGRVLGVDLGTVRIGVAASDRSGTLASPVSVLRRSGDEALDHQTIVGLARDSECTRIVVGLPLTLQGTVGPAARSVIDEVEALAKLAHADNIGVETWDERFTTVIAEQGLRETTPKRAQLSAPKSRGNKPGAQSGRRSGNRTGVDAAAATVILQSWIDAHS